MREISPSSPWLLKKRENTLKVLKEFSTALTVPRWEMHAILTFPQALMVLNMCLDIKFIISEHSHTYINQRIECVSLQMLQTPHFL